MKTIFTVLLTSLSLALSAQVGATFRPLETEQPSLTQGEMRIINAYILNLQQSDNAGRTERSISNMSHPRLLNDLGSHFSVEVRDVLLVNDTRNAGFYNLPPRVLNARVVEEPSTPRAYGLTGIIKAVTLERNSSAPSGTGKLWIFTTDDGRTLLYDIGNL